MNRSDGMKDNLLIPGGHMATQQGKDMFPPSAFQTCSPRFCRAADRAVWDRVGQPMMEYLELTKPRITVFILMSTAIGFFCVNRFAGAWTLFHVLLGTALMASGTAALNQWYERDTDAKMNRTKTRPIPSGRVSAGRALWFGVALSIGGSFDLWLGANRLAALLGIFTFSELGARRL
jgi:heme O synthase-like polyprenyltransferase